MSPNSWELAQEWSQNTYFDPEDRQELINLIEKNEQTELTERFYKDLEFGTGGLRSIIGMGRNRINKYTIRKATQAMANTAIKEKTGEIRFVISYDSRKFSREFAEQACGVLAANGVKTYLFDELTPVPLLSFAIRQLNASAGIMITASHNPKDYNGFKAYWSDGGQVTPPIDHKIIDAYNELNDWRQINYISFEEGQKKKLINSVPYESIESYFKVLKDTAVNPEMIRESGSKLGVVYTPLHGTGLKPCQRIMKDLGFSHFEVVSKQAQPDPTFPTVASPNPDNADALKMAIDQMLSKGLDIAYGTDPDTDRLGVVVTHQGEAIFLNGNQVAVLMLHYILTQKKKRATLPAQPLVIKSIVTSELQTKIVNDMGATLLNTLTGFKWMGALMSKMEREQSAYQFIFASEESFGYMTHDQIRDKDGVCAMAMMSEVALFYKLQEKTLIDALDEIYQQYGFYQEGLLQINYEGKEGAQKITRIMDFFRSNNNREFLAQTISMIDDLKTGQRKDLLTSKTHPLDFPSSNVLGIHFKSGNKLWLRPSGTEPKIKFYSMIKEDNNNLEQSKIKAKEKIQQWEREIQRMVENI